MVKRIRGNGQMKLPTFTPDQQQMILQAAAAILTENGSHEMSDQGAATLLALQRFVFRTAEPSANIVPKISPELGLCFTTAEQRQLGETVFTILPLIEEVPKPKKVELSEQVMQQAQLPNESQKMVRDLLANRATSVRLGVVRATFGERYRLSFLEALKVSAKAALGAEDPQITARYLPYRELPENTFGHQLIRYWEDNRFGLPGEKGAFPEELIAAHDAHHVLFNWDTTITGEWAIGQNEAGNREPVFLSFMVAAFINCQSGLRIAPESPAFLGTYDPELFFRELERGSAAAPGMMEPDWDFRPYLERPLDEVRKELGIRPGGNVSPGGKWCGPEGPPIERDQPLHRATVLKETAGDLVALSISGELTTEDLAFFEEIIAVTAAAHDQFDILVELQRFSGWNSPKSFFEDIRLFDTYSKKVRRIAVLGDSGWQKWLINIDRPFAAIFGIKERYFQLTEREQALAFCRGQSN
jgi:hypothetical protein